MLTDKYFLPLKLQKILKVYVIEKHLNNAMKWERGLVEAFPSTKIFTFTDFWKH